MNVLVAAFSSRLDREEGDLMNFSNIILAKTSHFSNAVELFYLVPNQETAIILI